MNHQASVYTLFIADLHLSAQRPDITAAFLRFLREEAACAEKLFILGDLFEVWIGDDNPEPLLAEIAEALMQLKQQGVPVYFCHGNRDFLLGKDYATRSGMVLLPPASVIDLYGTPTLLMHGDSLCTLDVQYQKFRRWWDQPWWQWLILHTPLWYRQRLAAKARRQSHTNKMAKTATIMDVTPEEVPQVMQQWQVCHLIHGHTHRPAVHQYQFSGTQQGYRYVLGDWYSQCSVLKASAAGWQLNFSPLVMPD